MTLLAEVEQMKFLTLAGTLVKLCNFATHTYQGCADERYCSNSLEKVKMVRHLLTNIVIPVTRE